ncbi:hypothetical protein CRM22_000202 [Opisthorchis felineus]|uniref:Uncharacterized protein n=1 Tax=Opisthorchis felineus TaxID=147828 RepID=A0A4S2MN43_OPIFE|nr:hypothetical protein CRM22_000202 [Opisthorchis felineus]
MLGGCSRPLHRLIHFTYSSLRGRSRLSEHVPHFIYVASCWIFGIPDYLQVCGMELMARETSIALNDVGFCGHLVQLRLKRDLTEILYAKPSMHRGRTFSGSVELCWFVPVREIQQLAHKPGKSW